MGAMPVLAGLYFGLSIAFAPSPDVTSEKVGEAVTYLAIPWWVKAIEFIAPIPVIGTVGVLGIIGYLVYRSRSS